ncbi:PKD domain-containing protein [Candidatus Peregrinibacteria bacterium]|nr:MAG: PKD domain-containing protein [Candidatus Peregrinibacteria bacterium]
MGTIKYLLFFGIFFTLLFGAIILPDTTGAVPSGKLPGENNTFAPPNQEDVPVELNNNDFRAQVLKITNYFLGFVGLIAVVALVFFGFLWITAGGNDDQIDRGKKGIIWVALGIILILLSWAIVSFLVGTTANAAGQNIHEDEQVVRDRLETLSESMDTKRISPLLSEEWSASYGAIFSDLSESETIRILKEGFHQGTMKNADEETQEMFKKIINITREFENLDLAAEDIQDQQRKLQSQFEQFRSQIRNRLQVLLRGIEETPRMDAKIETTPREGSLPLAVRISGLSSEDPSRITIPSQNYRWSFVDNKGVEQNLGDGATKVVDFSEPGSYVIRLEVSTASGKNILPGVATVIVRVFPEKTTARFTINGQDPTSIFKISLQDAKSGIIFDPSPSTIAEGAVASEYLWSFDGEREVQHFSTPVTHFFSEVGEKRVSLKISTNTEESGKEKEIRLQILPSFAAIDVSPEHPEAGQPVEINGSRSSLEEGFTPEYRWRILTDSGTLIHEESGNPRIAYVFSKEGEYFIELLLGNGVQAQQKISISSLSPTASFVGEPVSLADPALFRFDASASFDPNNQPLLYYWDFTNDGKFDIRSSQDTSATYRFLESGTHTVRLEVVSSTGKISSIEKSFVIKSVLSAHFSPSQSVVLPGEKIFFSATEKKASSYSWNFGDGSFEETSVSSVSHSYNSPGIYTALLKVQGFEGGESVFQDTVVVGGDDTPVVVARAQRDGWNIPLEEGVCNGKSAFRVRRKERITLVASSTISSDAGYTWSFSDNESASGAGVVKMFLATSSDGVCEQATVSVRDTQTGITATSPPLFFFVENILPHASRLEVSTTGSQCTTPCLISLSVQGATDPDGSIVEYQWWATREGSTERIGAQTTKVPNTQILLPTVGIENQENTFFLFAEIKDNDGGVTQLERESVRVKNGESSDFSINFFPDKTAVLSGQPIRFTAEVNDNSGNNDHRFFWDFNGDGLDDDITSGSETVSSFSKSGTYTVRLRVESKGVVRSAERTIFVEDESVFRPEYHSAERIIEKTPALSVNAPYALLTLSAVSDPEEENVFTIYAFGRNIDGTLAEGDIAFESEGAEILSPVTQMQRGVATIRLQVTGNEAVLRARLPLSIGILSETLSLPISSS